MKKLSDKELIELVKSLHDSIYVTECYGVKDMVNHELGLLELEKRGYHVVFANTLTISKKD